MTILTTARLRLEPFDEVHLDGLHAMNREPEVMRYINGGTPETREQTAAAIARVRARWAEWGYSWWAFIDQASGAVAGAGCIQHLGGERANPHEIGWRLHPAHWGKGLAIEAAQRMAAFAFDDVQVPLLVAIRNPANAASGRVMARLGMTERPTLERWHDTDCAVHEVTAATWQAGRRTP